MFRRKLIVGTLVVVLVLAAAGAALATTQPDSSNPFQNFIAKLAGNLGIDQDKVTAALETTKKQMLDEAVQQGKLTQEQADRIAADTKDKGWFGGPGFCGPGFNGPGFRDGGRGFKANVDIAGILGITQDQLKLEMQSGKKMEEILADHGLTMDEFNQKVLEAHKTALDTAVSEGKMTREQADKMLSNMENKQGWPGKAGFMKGGQRMGQRLDNPAL